MKIKGAKLRRDCLLVIECVGFLITRLVLFPLWLLDQQPVEEVTEFNDTAPINDYPNMRDAENVPRCPEFMQFFPESDTLGIGLERVEYCPDETAVFRIVGENTFSKQYRRRVYTQRQGDTYTYGNKKRRGPSPPAYPDGKYFKLNGERYYIRQSNHAPPQPLQDPKYPT